VVLYTASSVYHGLHHPMAKKVMQVVDHCTIYFLIAGTYTPILLCAIRPVSPGWAWTLFGLVTACAVVGVTFTAIDMKRWKKLSMTLYIVTGWMAVMVIGVVIRAMTPGQIACLIGGGLCYTGGILLYRRKDKKWMHALWHVFVLAGTILHYFMVYGGYRV